MDPNATLKQLRDLLEKWYSTDHTPDQVIELLSHVADRAQALDTWMSNGGFLPDAWCELKDDVK